MNNATNGLGLSFKFPQHSFVQLIFLAVFVVCSLALLVSILIFCYLSRIGRFSDNPHYRRRAQFVRYQSLTGPERQEFGLIPRPTGYILNSTSSQRKLIDYNGSNDNPFGPMQYLGHDLNNCNEKSDLLSPSESLYTCAASVYSTPTTENVTVPPPLPLYLANDLRSTPPVYVDQGTPSSVFSTTDSERSRHKRRRHHHHRHRSRKGEIEKERIA